MSKKTIQVILDKDKAEALEAIAKKKGLSVSPYIRTLLLEHLESLEKQEA